MPAKKSWGEHGTVRRYRQGGCDDLIGGSPGRGERCAKCKLAQREFGQGQRAGISNPVHGNVTPIDKRRRGSKSTANQGNSVPEEDSAPSKPRNAIGANERAVMTQLGMYKDDQPVRYEMALTAARILDDQERVSLHGTILRQLETITDKLTGGRKTKSKGRLMSVMRMTNSSGSRARAR